MTTDLALREDSASAVVITTEQTTLIKATIAQGATDAELKLFFYDCTRRGVHPLDKLIHFTKRGGRYTPITSIDFMRGRAHETGECAGIGDAEFEGDPRKDGFAARVTVRRLVQGQACEFVATARWEEYFPGDQQGHMWRKMPHTMLGKCAEALALRKAFPQQLSGLYAREEMDQAEEAPRPVVPQPAQRKSQAPEMKPPVVVETIIVPTAAAPKAEASPYVGAVTAVKDLPSGAALITLSTGFRCATKDADLIKAVKQLAGTGQLVELSTHAPKDPKNASILDEILPVQA